MAKISIPENNQRNFDVIHIFTESDLVTTQYMVENIPAKIIEKNVVVYLEKNETYEFSKTKINKIFSQSNFTINSESLIGISNASLNALGAFYFTNVGFINPNSFRFIGLIDPLLKNDLFRLSFGTNVNLVYNTKNWFEKPLNKKLLIKLANILQSPTQQEEKNLNLLKLIEYFFQKYTPNLS